MIYLEWETIGDYEYDEAGEVCVQVSADEDYIDEMIAQNKRILAVLTAKYPERHFRISKMHNHDFGSYQEVEEGFEYDDKDDDVY